MIEKRFLLGATAFLAVIALAGNGLAEIVFTYNSTPDDPGMSMPADQGWTEVADGSALWEAGDETGYGPSVVPPPGYVAHGQVSTGARAYIYQELTPQQEADALASGWKLTMRARFYQTWNAGFSPDGPDHELGFGVKTSSGDAIVAHKCQRDYAPDPDVYATVVALFGSDEQGGVDRVESPQIGEPDALYPSYMDYTLSYDPSSGMTTLAATGVHIGNEASCTLQNTLAPSTGLWDGVEVAEGEEENLLPAALYIGYPASAVTGGHAYIDYLTFEINPGSTLTPGDFNMDGAVDVSDLGILATNYGMTSGANWSMGDANNDGAVDVSDLGILATNYGSGTGLAVAATAVPEPGTLTMLLVLAGIGLAWSQHRHR